MKHNHNRRVLLSLYAAAASAMLLTGFTSLAAENDRNADQSTYIQDEIFQWDFAGTAGGIRGEAVQDTKEAVNAAHTAYLIRVEEERKAAEEAQRIAEEQAAAEARAAEEAAAAQAAAEAQAASVAASEQELLAALIYCEAGNQPYEGQVAVGAVVMNRVRSGSYPNTITEVIYQSGQFGPAMTGWLDSVLASGSYSDTARQAAADAIAGSNPVGDCLYFGNGNWGIQIGDHYFH
ncbi:MAG TPA: cell wall hydrolase [Candidatus Mediterraneibacter caccavium]|uniref:Cell wall hydrolase n=1 Tax=Candidatus Mediterraneibacter caccavium TaxID=2838661 RepID=A0A9D2ASL8_9FIRM|nr:cell wall hydrolase [Lachnoclostridium sp. An76]OUN33245.1 spore cortex-lytic enzyme [Lachnoclostridium sp. An76]HIX48413.1 cell wall hydrolase [Candidatus Mediterraneibacter caccavium]